jgi:IclR family mhp operon transcriptional activator
MAASRCGSRRQFGAGVQPANEIAQVAAPVLERLCRKVVPPSDLAVRDGARMKIVETSRRNTPFVVNRDVFAIRPHMLESAVARAYLAFCPEDGRRRIAARA